MYAGNVVPCYLCTFHFRFVLCGKGIVHQDLGRLGKSVREAIESGKLPLVLVQGIDLSQHRESLISNVSTSEQVWRFCAPCFLQKRVVGALGSHEVNTDVREHVVLVEKLRPNSRSIVVEHNRSSLDAALGVIPLSA